MRTGLGPARARAAARPGAAARRHGGCARAGAVRYRRPPRDGHETHAGPRGAPVDRLEGARSRGPGPPRRRRRQRVRDGREARHHGRWRRRAGPTARPPWRRDPSRPEAGQPRAHRDRRRCHRAASKRARARGRRGRARARPGAFPEPARRRAPRRAPRPPSAPAGFAGGPRERTAERSRGRGPTATPGRRLRSWRTAPPRSGPRGSRPCSSGQVHGREHAA